MLCALDTGERQGKRDQEQKGAPVGEGPPKSPKISFGALMGQRKKKGTKENELRDRDESNGDRASIECSGVLKVSALLGLRGGSITTQKEE